MKEVSINITSFWPYNQDQEYFKVEGEIPGTKIRFDSEGWYTRDEIKAALSITDEQFDNLINKGWE